MGFWVCKPWIESPPTVGLVDIGLPGLSGYDVAKQFRVACPDAETYLIALTGYGQTSDIMQAEEAGFDLHLTKPVDPDELMRILKQ